MDAEQLSAALRAIATKLDRDPGTPVDNPTPSFWQDPPHPFAHRQSPQLPSTADIVIIGSGISAISTAKHLFRHDATLKIVMLEARTAISGATGRNGGHIKAVPWADYAVLKGALGAESAMRISKFRLAHVDALLMEAEGLGDKGKAGLARRVTSLSAVYDEGTWEWAKEGLRGWLEDAPEERGRWTVHESEDELQELGLVNATGCITGPAGAAWPYRLMGAILSQLIEEDGLVLETGTTAHSIRRSTTTTTTSSSQPPYVVETSRGAIQARHVIHCTNGHAAHLLPYLRGKLWPLRGQMTVQSVPAGFPRRGASTSFSTMWAAGFDYITQSAGDDGALYLGGGLCQGGLERDEDIGCADDSQQSGLCVEHLASVPGRCFAHAGDGEGTRVERQWTGIMGFTGDELPLVDRVRSFMSGRAECEGGGGGDGGDGGDDHGGEWIAAGFNGYGMVHCWLSGKALAAMVVGRPEAELVDWFPRAEFACTQARLERMSPERGLRRLLELDDVP